MNARFILQACRPGGGEAQDPQFREALEQASRDPELMRWLADECALDSCIAAKLRAAAKPPPGLLVQLLALRPTARHARLNNPLPTPL